MKTKIKLLGISFFSFIALATFWANTINIEKVEVLSQNSLKMSLTWWIVDITDGDIQGDIKVFKDLTVQKAQKSPVADNIVSITLSEELVPNTSYSILSVFWAEGNMDFTLGKELNGVEFVNTDTENVNIDKLVVKDSTEIDIYYKLALQWEEFEYKVLQWIWVDILSKLGNDININLKNSLDSDSNYIIMLISLKDTFWKEITFDDGIFDFSTQEINKEALQILTSTWSQILNNTWTQLPEEWLNAAKEIWNVKEVAMKTSKTPNTWPETWIFIALTFIINTIIFFARKKQLKSF